MKRFIVKIIVFITLFLILSCSVLYASICLQRDLLNYVVPADRPTLIVGNSHTECSVNDQIVTNVYNLPYSGECYFFTYVKIKKIIAQNPHIKSVVLGYSYFDYSVGADKIIRGEVFLSTFFPAYFFMMNFSDFMYVYKLNKRAVASSFFQSGGAIQFVNILSAREKYRGGYLKLKRDKIDDSKAAFSTKSNDAECDLASSSQVYLGKIYDYLTARHIKLILLHTPMHPLLIDKLEYRKASYYDFVSQRMPEAEIINHSRFELPESFYGDINHLNYKGANVYSKFLMDNNVFGVISDVTDISCEEFSR